MADNYTFLDASGATQTAGSSTIGGIIYPVVKVPDLIKIVGSVQLIGATTSILGLVNINSVIGTYAEDSASATGDKGMFTLAVRNDSLSSVSSADGDYTQFTVGPVGEQITANAPITKWIRVATSIFSGASVQLLAPQGTSVFTYITGLQVGVWGGTSSSVLVTFTGGLGGVSSVLGYATAALAGGANPVIPNAWVTGANSGFSASISTNASIYVAVQGFISKT